MIDSGIICKGNFEGREVLGLRLNWHKRYITLGPVATLLGLAFKASTPIISWARKMNSESPWR
jgi:acyl-CoA dehydrogenase